MIGGNTIAEIQLKTSTAKNEIGEAVPGWEAVAKIKGFLDLSGGNSNYVTYNTKVQESTHIFLCDFVNLVVLGTEWEWDTLDFKYSFINKNSSENIQLISENARIVIDGKRYDVMVIDDPMGLHKHLELYLKYTGGQ